MYAYGYICMYMYVYMYIYLMVDEFPRLYNYGGFFTFLIDI